MKGKPIETKEIHSLEEKIQVNEQEMITNYRYPLTDQQDAKTLGLSQEDYEAMKHIEAEILTRLEIAVKQNLNPNTMEAVEIGKLHKRWLQYIWDEYEVQAHLNLVDSYLIDKKFEAYYDKNVEGCSRYLRIAVRNYLFNEEPKESPKTNLNG